MKRIITLLVWILIILTPWNRTLGQGGNLLDGQFEWVKGYYGERVGNQISNMIKGTVSDSEGNLYILGQIQRRSQWEGEDLQPNGMQNAYSILIAKIAPDGEMLWKKVISSNNNTYARAYDIRKVGDTAFACLVDMSFPTEDHYTYYLDTLLTRRGTYPVNGFTLMDPTITALITFDFKGNVEEQHFFWMTYTDTVGNDIVKWHDNYSDPWYYNNYFFNPSFDIDPDGNIYISRELQDDYGSLFSVTDGQIKGVKFWADHRLVGSYQIDKPPYVWHQQLIKFAPHFDTVLAWRYIIQHSDSISYTTSASNVVTDVNQNVYFRCLHNTYLYEPLTMVIDSVRGLEFTVSEKSTGVSYLVQYDSNLNANWLITLGDSVINPSGVCSNNFFGDLAFDNDSNLLFISANTARSTYLDTMVSNFYSYPTYMGETLHLKNSAFFMAFRLNGANPPTLHSYGSFPSPFQSTTVPEGSKGNFVVRNNRVFMQCGFWGTALFPSQTIRYDSKYTFGHCLAIFDYKGNFIDGIDYDCQGFETDMGSIELVDSTLYLCGVTSSDATFGDIPFVRWGENVYVAKYVDTSLMTPHITIHIPDIDADAHLGVYPNPFQQRVTIQVDASELQTTNDIASAWLTDMMGHREKVQLIDMGGNQYTLNLTNRSQGIYLLTLVTSGGTKHTVRLVKQGQ